MHRYLTGSAIVLLAIAGCQKATTPAASTTPAGAPSDSSSSSSELTLVKLKLPAMT